MKFFLAAPLARKIDRDRFYMPTGSVVKCAYTVVNHAVFYSHPGGCIYRMRTAGAGAAAREDPVDGDRPEDGTARKVPSAAPPATSDGTAFPWPWGLVAIGVMALAWVGIYLIWNGFVFLFGL